MKTCTPGRVSLYLGQGRLVPRARYLSTLGRVGWFVEEIRLFMNE
jgi:hypothetical protein